MMFSEWHGWSYEMSKRNIKPSHPDPIYFTTLSTPLGLMGIAGSEKGLVRIVLQLPGEFHFKKYLKKSYPCECLNNPPFFENVVKQLNLYFAGKLKIFSGKLDISRGTPFQQKVWRQLITIPYGETQSYRTLAQAIGHPRAFRAVGGANGKNPLPLIIPCHRVIRENGEMGGYTGGLHLKRFLLDLEKT